MIQLVLVLLIGQQVGMAQGNPYDQLPVVSSLCYDYGEERSIRIADNFNPKTLSDMDKIGLQPSNYNLSTQLYFDRQGDLVTDKSFISQENFLPEFGNYKYDSFNDVRSLTVPASDAGQRAYNAKNDMVKALSLLHSFIFVFPDAKILQAMKSEGYSIIEDGPVVTATSKEQVFLWDRKNKVTVVQQIDKGGLASTKVKVYRYDKKIGSDLIVRSEVITPNSFSDGQYFENVLVKSYENYTVDCARSSGLGKNASTEEVLVKDFSIFPNPTKSDLNVRIDPSTDNGRLTVSSLTSQEVLMMRIVDAEGGQLSIDVTDLPPGIYLVALERNGKKTTNKFVKL